MEGATFFFQCSYSVTMVNIIKKTSVKNNSWTEHLDTFTLAVDILIKGRKSHKNLFPTLNKTSQTLNVMKYSEL